MIKLLITVSAQKQIEFCIPANSNRKSAVKFYAWKYTCFQLHFPYYEWWILAGDTYVQQTLVAPLFTYKSVFDGLTRQEQTVFKKLIERKSRSQITKELNIVERSLENYLSKIYQKTGCKNHEELIKKFGEWNEEKKHEWEVILFHLALLEKEEA